MYPPQVAVRMLAGEAGDVSLFLNIGDQKEGEGCKLTEQIRFLLPASQPPPQNFPRGGGLGPDKALVVPDVLFFLRHFACLGNCLPPLQLGFLGSWPHPFPPRTRPVGCSKLLGCR